MNFYADTIWPDRDSEYVRNPHQGAISPFTCVLSRLRSVMTGASHVMYAEHLLYGNSPDVQRSLFWNKIRKHEADKPKLDKVMQELKESIHRYLASLERHKELAEHHIAGTENPVLYDNNPDVRNILVLAAADIETVLFRALVRPCADCSLETSPKRWQELVDHGTKLLRCVAEMLSEGEMEYNDGLHEDTMGLCRIRMR